MRREKTPGEHDRGTSTVISLCPTFLGDMRFLR
jgi:hypothetical protein